MLQRLLNRKKSFSVNVSPGNHHFALDRKETLLAGALKAGLNWPHKCQVGSCGRCKCKILDGAIRPEIDFNCVLTPAEVKAGYILACQSTPKTDLKVTVNLLNKGN